MKCYFILGVVLAAIISSTQSYYIGIAQYDITGPAAEIGMVSLGGELLSALTNILFLQMGYANLEQIAAGIHQRLWSRTFILANTLDLASPRIALVTLDIQATSQIIKLEVITS